MDKPQLRKRKRQLQKNLEGLYKFKYDKDYSPEVINPQVKALASKIEAINAALIVDRVDQQKLLIEWIWLKYEKCKIKLRGDYLYFQNQYGNFTAPLLRTHQWRLYPSGPENMDTLSLLPNRLADVLGDKMTFKERFSTDIEGYSINLDLWTLKWKVNGGSAYDTQNKIFKSECIAGLACDLLNESKDVKRFILGEMGIPLKTRKDNYDWWNWSRKLEEQNKKRNAELNKQFRIKQIINTAEKAAAINWKYKGACPDFLIDKKKTKKVVIHPSYEGSIPDFSSDKKGRK